MTILLIAIALGAELLILGLVFALCRAAAKGEATAQPATAGGCPDADVGTAYVGT